eukprot:COSAG05_NODE_55_length_23493_cov_709.337907_20_plen_87_part_00
MTVGLLPFGLSLVSCLLGAVLCLGCYFWAVKTLGRLASSCCSGLSLLGCYFWAAVLGFYFWAATFGLLLLGCYFWTAPLARLATEL